MINPITGDKGLHRVKVGCCGFPCSRKDYFSQFKLVEVQQTFYKIPKLETALGWRVNHIIEQGRNWLPRKV